MVRARTWAGMTTAQGLPGGRGPPRSKVLVSPPSRRGPPKGAASGDSPRASSSRQVLIGTNDVRPSSAAPAERVNRNRTIDAEIKVDRLMAGAPPQKRGFWVRGRFCFFFRGGLLEYLFLFVQVAGLLLCFRA